MEARKLKREVYESKIQVENEKEALLKQITKLAKELKYAHDRFEELSDELLIDGQIYEIKAIQLRYNYLLNKAKELGIIVKKI